jgi:hypothetical protein
VTWEVARHASLLDTPFVYRRGPRRASGGPWAGPGPGRPTSKDNPDARIRVAVAADEKAGGAVASVGGGEAQPLPSAAGGGGLRGPVLVLPQPDDRVGQRGQLG